MGSNALECMMDLYNEEKMLIRYSGAAGFSVKTSRSNISSSRYLLCQYGNREDHWDHEFKVRLSDHDLPDHYSARPDYHIDDSHANSWFHVVAKMCARVGATVPGVVKRMITKDAQAVAAYRAEKAASLIRTQMNRDELAEKMKLRAASRTQKIVKVAA